MTTQWFTAGIATALLASVGAVHAQSPNAGRALAATCFMHQHAKGYTDAQFVLIADYFASVPSTPSAKRAPSGSSIPQGGGY